MAYLKFQHMLINNPSVLQGGQVSWSFLKNQYLTLSWARNIQSATSCNIHFLWFSHSQLLLPHGLLFRFAEQNVAVLVLPMCTTYPPHLTRLDLIFLITFGCKRKLRSSSLRDFRLYPLHLSYSPSTQGLYWNILFLFSLLKWETKCYRHKATW